MLEKQLICSNIFDTLYTVRTYEVTGNIRLNCDMHEAM
jgi:hypothetical protein